MTRHSSISGAHSTRRGVTRWLLAAALFSLFSLQVVAADHWHGVDDTAHCDVCLHAQDLPVAAFTSAPPVTCRFIYPIAVYAVDVPATPRSTTGNRDPPQS